MRKQLLRLTFAALSVASCAIVAPAIAADYQPRQRMQPAYMPPPQPVYQQPAYMPPPVQSSCCCPSVRRGLFSFTVGCGSSGYPQYAQPYPAYPQYQQAYPAPAYYPQQPYPAYQPSYYQPQPGYAPQVGVGVGPVGVGVGVGAGYPRY